MARSRSGHTAYVCSFCTRGQDEVQRLIAGPGGVSALEYTSIGNPEVGPEISTELELGFERRQRLAQLVEQRHRLARLRGELLGLLTSEMRNPLTSMITALEMTLGQNLPEGADRVLVGARRSGQRLLDLVTTMIEIDQIERSPNTLQRAIAPLRPVLEAGIAQTAPLAQRPATEKAPMRMPLVAGLGLALVVAGCGGGAGDGGGPGGADGVVGVTRVEVTVTDRFSIKPSPMNVAAGVPVTFVVQNTGSLTHQFYVGDAAAQHARAADHVAVEHRGAPRGVSPRTGSTRSPKTFENEFEIHSD